jgi:RimJ/RimL family protein N-acetyltransferase/aryl carrier-like protein
MTTTLTSGTLTTGPTTEPDQLWDGSTRDSHRRELAALLGLDPPEAASLPDHARLVEDLGLDSLAMMRVLVWLQGKGVVVDDGPDRPARVGELLSLVDTAATEGLSIRIANGPDPGPIGVADLPAAMAPPADPLVPVLAGHGLRLDPVTPDDVGFLYTLAVAPETGFRWRYRGAPPPLEQFGESMWNQVLVQFVARRTADGQPAGQVVAYGADPIARFAYVGAVFAPPHTGAGLAAHAVSLFVRYLFHTFPFTKLYLEVPGYNWPQVRSGEGTLFVVEGVLRDHYQYAGQLWHQYLCAIYRDRLPADTPR